MARLNHPTWEVIRDYLMINRGLPVSMSTLVSLTGGRWSSNQRLNEMIRHGEIGLIVKEMVTSAHMRLRLIRFKPLWCPSCRHYTHLVQIQNGQTRRGNVLYGLYCASRVKPGGRQCGKELGNIVKNRLVLYRSKRG